MYVRARKGIGYLPQEPSIFRRPVGREEHPRDSRDAGSELGAAPGASSLLLAELNLTPLAKAPAYTLSGGERRRAKSRERW